MPRDAAAGDRPRGAARGLLHGGCVRLDGGAGVILRGAPGSGKSDLLLRLIADGADLVADDQVVVERRGGRVLASPPAALAGLLEVRGVGVLRLRHVGPSPVRLVVDLCRREDVARLPSAGEARCELLGVRLPRGGRDPLAGAGGAQIAVGRGGGRAPGNPGAGAGGGG